MNNQNKHIQSVNQTNQTNASTQGRSIADRENYMFSTATDSTSLSNQENSSGNSNITAIVGGWLEAVGTVLAAVGNTPSSIFSRSMLTGFRLIGNTLQASGSALVAENEELTLDIVGDQLQAIGNITVIASILDQNQESRQRLNTQGNLLQLLGAGLSINTQQNLSFIQALDNIGNIIQAIGNTIQVFANTATEEGVRLNAVGTWIQAVGTVITAIAGDYDD